MGNKNIGARDLTQKCRSTATQREQKTRFFSAPLCVCASALKRPFYVLKWCPCIKVVCSIFSVIALPLVPLDAQCTSCSRGNLVIEPYDYGERPQCWEYGPTAIRSQTAAIMKPLMDDWYAKNGERFDKPRILITNINNTTGEYIASNEVRSAFQSVADEDGRFTIIIEDAVDNLEFNQVTSEFDKIQKQEDEIRVKEGEKIIPDFFAKIRFKKETTCSYEEYWMTIALYNLESKDLIGSGTNIFRRQQRQRR